MKGVRDACPAALQAITIFLESSNQIQHPPYHLNPTLQTG